MRTYLTIAAIAIFGVGAGSCCRKPLELPDNRLAFEMEELFCPNERGEVEFGILGNANGIPDNTFADLIFNPAVVEECSDIFMDFPKVGNVIDEPANQERWQQLSAGQQWEVQYDRLNKRQLFMIGVFSAITTWKVTDGKVGEYALTVPSCGRQAEIRLYKSACSVTRVYGDDLRGLLPAPRFWFVAAHELGHVIDLRLGGIHEQQADGVCTYSSSGGSAENRATYYGTFFIECLMRQWTALFAYLMHSSDNPESYAALHSNIDSAVAMAKSARSLRAAYRPSEQKFVSDQTRPTQQAFACGTKPFGD